MAHEAGWYIQDRVLFIRVWGQVTVEDAQAFSKAAMALMESSPQAKVHAMLDDSGVTGTSGGLGQFKDAMAMATHEKAGWMLNIGQANALITFLSTTITRLLGAHYRRFNTLKEGIQFLKENDPELKNYEPRAAEQKQNP